jgi:hypothetical protein
MLRVCTSSTESQLATTGDVKSVLGVTGTSDDAYLDKLITRAGGWAEDYVGYPLGSPQVYQETVPAYGSPALVVSRTPVRAVLRLFDSTATGEATEYCSTDFRIEDADAGLIMFTDDSIPGWTARQQTEIVDRYLPGTETRPWLIEYEAGFVGAGGTTATCGGTTSTGRTLPGAIEDAVIERVVAQYERRGPLASKKVGEISVSYREQSVDPAEALLERYRRIF